MRLTTTLCAISMGLVMLGAPAAFADGGCSESEKRGAEDALRKAEDAEKVGRTKEAFDAARTVSLVDCAANGSERRYRLVERTSKQLGAEAEKAGRFGEAFEYHYTPYSLRTNYHLADADRTMLKHANMNSDNYKVVSEAVSYFNSREDKPHLEEVRALAKRGGDKLLAKEEKSFAARKNSLDDLQQAKEWLDLVGEGKQAQTRAEQRGDTLLSEGSIRAVERAFSCYDFARNPNKLNAAKARALKFGDDAASKGDHGLAAEFYALSGDKIKAAAIKQQKEKAESQRQDTFRKEQKSLEKELGL